MAREYIAILNARCSAFDQQSVERFDTIQYNKSRVDKRITTGGSTTKGMLNFETGIRAKNSNAYLIFH